MQKQPYSHHFYLILHLDATNIFKISVPQAEKKVENHCLKGGGFDDLVMWMSCYFCLFLKIFSVFIGLD
jgi:hypothetical protein